MSTRYIKRDNVRIIGLAKNASQAIKQVALRNNNWELYNEIKDEEGLEVFRKRFADENVNTFDEAETTCCYRESDKLWAEHDNVKWEIFYSTADSETFYNKE